MSWFRRRLVPVAVTWLSLHVMVVSGGALDALLGAPTSASDLICTCAHGPDHGACPMHRAPADASRCRLQNARGDLAGAILSIIGPVALPPVGVESLALEYSSGPRSLDTRLPADRTLPPDAPPPRA